VENLRLVDPALELASKGPEIKHSPAKGADNSLHKNARLLEELE
jgi:hypothetical protein